MFSVSQMLQSFALFPTNTIQSTIFDFTNTESECLITNIFYGYSYKQISICFSPINSLSIKQPYSWQKSSIHNESSK